MSHEQNERPNFIVSPGQGFSRLAALAEKNSTEPGLPYPGSMAETVVPLRSTEIEVIIGRPGHGKTSFMTWRAIQAAKMLRDQGRRDEMVVFMTWEQPVEHVEAYLQTGAPYTPSDIAWGRVSRADIVSGGTDRLSLPLYLGGWSISQDTPKVPMTIDAVIENIVSVEKEFGKRPFHVVLDYLQIIHITRGDRGNEASVIREAAKQVDIMAKFLGCSVSLGVQASGNVDAKTTPIPGTGDVWYAKVAVDAVAAKIFGVGRPIKWENKTEGEKIAWAGRQYEVCENLFFMQMNKQRFEKGFHRWGMSFDIDNMILGDMQPSGGVALYETNGSTPF